MISPPEALPLLSLAIKGSPASRSIHARWIHTPEGAKEGVVIGLRVGGGFHFQMTEDHWRKGTRLVLLAGGVGINPLMSILAHVVGWVEGREGEGGREGEEGTKDVSGSDGRTLGQREEKTEEGKTKFQASLIYSAATRAELIFEDQIRKWAETHATWLSVLFIVTREEEGEGGWEGRRERMDEEVVWGAVDGGGGEGGREKALVYVCGPPKMTDEVEKILVGGEEEGREGGRRLEKAQVVTEKWW
jgi:NAD(P)H-flavin reductase